jgi:hypothetical protein
MVLYFIEIELMKNIFVIACLAFIAVTAYSQPNYVVLNQAQSAKEAEAARAAANAAREAAQQQLDLIRDILHEQHDETYNLLIYRGNEVGSDDWQVSLSKIAPWKDDKLWNAYATKLIQTKKKLDIQVQEFKLLEFNKLTNTTRYESLKTTMLNENQIISDMVKKTTDVQNKYKLQQFYKDHPKS